MCTEHVCLDEMLRTFIGEVRVSNREREADSPDQIYFVGCLRPSRKMSGDSTSTKPQPPPSKSFPVHHYTCIILPFDTMVSRCLRRH
jgi:hypothetical protein